MYTICQICINAISSEVSFRCTNPACIILSSSKDQILTRFFNHLHDKEIIDLINNYIDTHNPDLRRIAFCLSDNEKSVIQNSLLIVYTKDIKLSLNGFIKKLDYINFLG